MGGGDGDVAAVAGPGQRMLMGILKAFAKQHPDIGYCQGMNYIAASFMVLYNARGGVVHPGRLRPDTGEVVYWLMTALARKYACDQLWRRGVPRLRLIAFQLSRLLRQFRPRLWRHFQDVGLSMEVLAAQWLLPLMSITLPFETLARVWELFFAEVRVPQRVSHVLSLTWLVPVSGLEAALPRRPGAVLGAGAPVPGAGH